MKGLGGAVFPDVRASFFPILHPQFVARGTGRNSGIPGRPEINRGILVIDKECPFLLECKRD
jgi:hypothetical protein